MSVSFSQERENYGAVLCDEGVNPTNFKSKACFTFFDIVSFEAELRVEEKIHSSPFRSCSI